MTQIQCPTCKLNKITSRSRITKAGVFHRQCDNKTLQRYHCHIRRSLHLAIYSFYHNYYLLPDGARVEKQVA